MSGRSRSRSPRKAPVFDGDPIFLPQIKRVANYGVYAWKTSKPSTTSMRDVTASDLQARILSDEKSVKSLLPRIKPGYSKCVGHGFQEPRDLKRQFPNIPAAEYPYSIPKCVPLYIAEKRGCDLKDVHFLFGGSTLGVLAKRKNWSETNNFGNTNDVPAKTIGQLVNGVLAVAKHKPYYHNGGEFGFQFERLVTSQANIDFDFSLETLQVLAFGDSHKVLFSTEVDAVDDRGNLCELKMADPRFFAEQKRYLQMVASGANKLLLGDRDRRDNRLQRIEEWDIKKMANPPNQRGQLPDISGDMRNILRSLEELRELQKTMEPGVCYELVFEQGADKLIAKKTREDVMNVPEWVSHELV